MPIVKKKWRAFNPQAQPRRLRSTMMTPVRPLGIIDLSHEVIYHVVDSLDDGTFCAARAAHSIFRVHDGDEIHHTRRVPRWLAGDAYEYVKRGHVEAVQTLKDSGHEFGARDLCTAVEYGNVAVVAILYDDCITECEREVKDLFAVAASKGHLDVMRLLHERDHTTCTAGAMAEAAHCGHMAIVEFLYKERGERDTWVAFDSAVTEGHTAIVQFLCADQPLGEIEDAFHESLESAHPDVSAHLAKELAARIGNTPWTDDRLDWCAVSSLLDKAAKAPGHAAATNVLADLVALGPHGSPHIVMAAMRAAGDGLADTVRVLISRYCDDWDLECVLMSAAGGGHADAVRVLLECGRAVDPRVALGAAASNGHIGILRLLCAHANPTRDDGRASECAEATSRAAAHGHSDCVRFLVESGDTDRLVAAAMVNCVSYGRADGLRLLFGLYGTDFFDDCATESICDVGYVTVLRTLSLRPMVHPIDLEIRNCRCESTCRFALLGAAASRRHGDVLELLCAIWSCA